MRILITGAGQGLGSWIARLALERGHNVIATVHSLSHVCEETQALCAAFPVQFRLLKMDVTSDRDVAEVEALLRAEQPQLDAIVNNAGIMIERDHTIEELDLDAVIRSFQVNTVGPMRVVQKFLPLLSAGTRSCIVNIFFGGRNDHQCISDELRLQYVQMCAQHVLRATAGVSEGTGYSGLCRPSRLDADEHGRLRCAGGSGGHCKRYPGYSGTKKEDLFQDCIH